MASWLLLAFAPPAAQAQVHHAYLGTRLELTAAEAFEPRALAVQPGEGGGPGRLWVAQSNNPVAAFNAATGAIEAEFQEPSPRLRGSQSGANGLAVGESTGETQIYATYGFAGAGATLEVGVFAPSGTFLARWTGADTPATTFGESVGGVVIDANTNTLADPASGRVYVDDTGENVVDVYEPQPHGGENYVTAITGPVAGKLFHHLGRVAVDQVTGDVLVGDETSSGQQMLYILAPTALGYELVRETAGAPVPLAVDPGENGEHEDYYAIEQAQVIDEFDATAVASGSNAVLGRITGSETPGGTFGSLPSRTPAQIRSIAVDPATHEVYVGVQNVSARASVVAFAKAVVLPDVTDEPAQALAVHEGHIEERLNGSVNPRRGETGQSAECDFVWGASPRALSHIAKCPSDVDGSAPEPVSAVLGGLEPDTTYYYRLQASNGNGTNPGEEEENGELSPPHSFTTPGPGLHEVSVSKVTATSATLEATFDPHGSTSSYQFEYGIARCSGAAPSCHAAPAAAEAVGAGEEAIELLQHVQELKASTEYHYRLVVTSDIKLLPTEPARAFVFAGPERTFVTPRDGGAVGLIDTREWELVSPAVKNGALVLGLNQNEERMDIQAAAGGGMITYATKSPTEVGGARGYASRTQVLSARGEGGWRSCDLGTFETVPEGSGNDFAEFPAFSSGLSAGLVSQEGFNATLLSEEASERTPYVAQLGGCGAPPSFVPIATGKEPFADVTSGKRFGGTPSEAAVTFVDASADLSHVLLDSTVQLTTAPTVSGEQELYEWSEGAPPAERLKLISEIPGGGAATSLTVDGSNDSRHAVSNDGSRVFWPGYMRDLLADGGRGETIAVAGTFQVATPEITGAARLSRALFTQGTGLYECEIAETAGQVHCNAKTIAPPGAGVVGNVSASEDGSYVYFVANGVLGDGAELGATNGECSVTAVVAPEATCNLYVFHEGATHFIATVSAEDEMDWGHTGGASINKLASLWAAASPNGHYFAFMSSRALTGYDNRDVKSGDSDEEVFLYDAATRAIVCASCNRTQERPTGVEDGSIAKLVFPSSQAANYPSKWYAANLPGWSEVGPFGFATHQPRYLSNDGRLFFDAAGALVPGDSNGTQDVYEYEPLGGSCTSEAGGRDVVFEPERDYEVEGRTGAESAGCVGLISSGRSPEESAFLDADETGGEAFFLTGEQLGTQDKDNSPDVYVARECSGASPCFTSPPEPPEPCDTTDSCRPAPSPQPGIFGAPSSATFSGPTNVAPSAIGRPATAPATRSQLLARALRACRRKRNRHRRSDCERTARRRYRAVTAARVKTTHGGSVRR